MAQNDRLESLVNEVERESRQYASFDEYLASKNKGAECQKDASVVAVNSPSESNGKVDAVADSSEPSSAVPASQPEPTPDVRKVWMEKPGYVEGGLKSEPLAHPVAPNVEAEEPQVKAPESVQETTTRLELRPLPWAGPESSYLSEITEVDTTEPEWWKAVFHDGKKIAISTADLSDVIKHYHKLEEAIKKIKRSQQGVRAGLEERLHGTNSEQRARLKELDKDYRAVTNQKSAERMKSERAAKPAVNPIFKTIDTMQTAMGMDADDILAALEKKGKLDVETRAYVAKKFGGA